VLFLLLPITWLALIGLVLALCLTASRSDAAPVQIVDGPSSQRRSSLMLWEDGSLAVRASAPSRGAIVRDGAHRRSRRVAHSVR
jgi:hypothetical protein